MVAPLPFFVAERRAIRMLEEALALEKMGHEISLLTYPVGENVWEKVETKIRFRRSANLAFWTSRSDGVGFLRRQILNVGLLLAVLAEVIRFRPHIIHGFLHNGAFSAWIAQKLIFWIKFKLVFDFPGAHLCWCDRILAPHGDFILTSVHQQSEDLLKVVNYRIKVRTIIDGANLKLYSNTLDRNRLKLFYELPAEKIIAVCLGESLSKEEVDLFRETVRLTIIQTQGVYFVIAGELARTFIEDGTLKDFPNNVRLVYPLDYFEVPNLLSACDIGIDPSIFEGMQASRRSLHYMAAGLPVACFDTAYNREYLDDGAFYAHEKNGVGLSAEILRFLRDRSELLIRGEINQRKVVNYSWERSAEKIDLIYRELMPDAETGNNLKIERI